MSLREGCPWELHHVPGSRQGDKSTRALRTVTQRNHRSEQGREASSSVTGVTEGQSGGQCSLTATQTSGYGWMDGQAVLSAAELRARGIAP